MHKIHLQLQLFFLIFSALFINDILVAQNINTVTGIRTSYGDGLRSFGIHESYGMTADNYGNIFFTEPYNETLRRINTQGIATLLAGIRQEPGFSGDGNLATNATLSYPLGVAVSTTGEIYFVDDNRVRKIDKQGIIHTIAGDSIAGYNGDNILAVNAKLNYPTDVAVDSKGNIYIADQYNARVRKIDLNCIITTYAGNGKPRYLAENVIATKAQLSPVSLAVDNNDNLFVADSYNERIRKIDSNDIIITYAGSVQQVGAPSDVCVDNNGNIYFVSDNSNILSINANGKLHHILTSSNLYAVTYSNGFLYYAFNGEDVCYFEAEYINRINLHTNTIEKFTDKDAETHDLQFIELENKPAGLSSTGYPYGMHYQNGSLYFAESNGRRIRKVNSNGIISTIAGDGAERGNGYGDGGDALRASFEEPVGVTVDAHGNIFIADQKDSRIRKIDRNNIITTFAKISGPLDVAVDKNDNLYVSSLFGGIYKIDKNGNVQLLTNSYSATGLYIDTSDNLFFGYGNQAIELMKSGNTKVIAGTGSSGYSGDSGLAVNATLDNVTSVTQDSKGNFFIADFDNNKVRKIDTKGIITTVVGKGIGDIFRCDGDYLKYGGYSGDGDSAIKSNIAPYYVVTNAKDNLLISDNTNNAIREVEFNCHKKPISFSYAIDQYLNSLTEQNLDCNLLCTIEPTGNYFKALNVFVTTNVWVENKIVRDSTGKPFVPRHYQIFPDRNSYASSTAKITLYFNQSDFDVYNKSTGKNYLMLPTSPTDSNAIENLVIYGYNSKSADSLGLPVSYHSRQIKINPANRNIVWNAEGNYWEVTININGLGGFFVGTEKESQIVSDKEEASTKNEVINIYPNPASNNFHVSLPGNLLYKNIQLFNSNGKLISSTIAESQNVTFNIQELASGIYLIRFADEEVKKVIISKN